MSHSRNLFIIAAFSLFAVSAFLLFQPFQDPTGKFAYTPGLAVVDSSYSVDGESLTSIEFITTGKDDLEISSDHDFELISLSCGSRKIHPKSYDPLEFPGYSCDVNSVLDAKLLSKETRFYLKFGSDVQVSVPDSRI